MYNNNIWKKKQDRPVLYYIYCLSSNNNQKIINIYKWREPEKRTKKFTVDGTDGRACIKHGGQQDRISYSFCWVPPNQYLNFYFIFYFVSSAVWSPYLSSSSLQFEGFEPVFLGLWCGDFDDLNWTEPNSIGIAYETGKTNNLSGRRVVYTAAVCCCSDVKRILRRYSGFRKNIKHFTIQGRRRGSPLRRRTTTRATLIGCAARVPSLNYLVPRTFFFFSFSILLLLLLLYFWKI
jgi:hypothetical protein